MGVVVILEAGNVMCVLRCCGLSDQLCTSSRPDAVGTLPVMFKLQSDVQVKRTTTVDSMGGEMCQG